jgi:hypothetical protein
MIGNIPLVSRRDLVLAASSGSQRLSFLIAGVQKAGTTALDAYLRSHPQLTMGGSKELHFFDRENGVDWRDPDYEVLHAHFPERGGLRGESTPITLYWTPAHYRILRYNPDIKFIIMLREPGARAFSHWRMNITRGLDDMDFSRAIREGRIRTLDDPVQSGISRHTSYIERGYYGRQIAQLATLFPTSNMLFLRQADLLADPDAVLANIARFLDIPPFDPVVSTLLNTSEDATGQVMSEVDRAYLTDIFKTDLVQLKLLTGLELPVEDSR